MLRRDDNISSTILQNGAHRSHPLQAYQAALERHGYAAEAVARRVALAQRILAAIDPADNSNQAYCEAVARVSGAFADPASIARCQRVARDFLPFFVEAGRIAQPSQVTPTHAPKPLSISLTLPPHVSLDDLIGQAGGMVLTTTERAALRAYAVALRRAGLHAGAQDRRLAIARLLLLTLRPLERCGRNYRAMIKALLPLFTRDETRSYFLGVARDFYDLGLQAKDRPRD